MFYYCNTLLTEVNFFYFLFQRITLCPFLFPLIFATVFTIQSTFLHFLLFLCLDFNFQFYSH
eukprot:UN01675